MRRVRSATQTWTISPAPTGAGQYTLHMGRTEKLFPMSPEIFGAIAERLKMGGKLVALEADDGAVPAPDSDGAPRGAGGAAQRDGGERGADVKYLKWYVLILGGLLPAGPALDLLGDALLAWAAR